MEANHPSLDEIPIEAAGSSALDPTLTAKGEMAECHIPGLRNVMSYPGLTLMPWQFPYNCSNLKSFPRTPYKTRQYRNLKFRLSHVATKELLFLAMSNDWKYFLSAHYSDRNATTLLALTPHALEIWSKLTDKEKANYSHRGVYLLTKDSTAYLNERLDEYTTISRDLFEGTALTTVYHSSVLERIHKDFPNLDIYFAILNALLFRHLNNLSRNQSIVNRSGQPIQFVYLKASTQFFSSEVIFNRPRELRSGYLTHRTKTALSNLTKIYWNLIKAHRTRMTKTSPKYCPVEVLPRRSIAP